MSKRSIIVLILSLFAAAFVVATVVVLRLWVVAPFRIPTAGMEPSVRQNSTVWVLTCAYRQPGAVHCGDIVAYHVEFMGQREVYLKRVIGLPGDKLRITEDSVFLNGRELPKRPVGVEGKMQIFEEDCGGTVYRIGLVPSQRQFKNVDMVVPPDCFFVLGDNRRNSLDSRYTGPVNYRDLIGKKL